MRHRFRLGSWTVDPAANRIEGDGRVGHLEPKVMDLLVVLAAHRGEVLSRERLFAEVWPDLHVSDEALTTAIYQLRRALGDRAHDPFFVETVPKRGYRLVASVEPIPEGDPVDAAVAAPRASTPPRHGPGFRWWRRWAVAAGLAMVALLVLVPGSRETRPAAPGVPAPADAELLQRARRSLDRWGPDGVTSALAGYEAAVAHDPSNPAALAGLAESLMRAKAWGILPVEEVESRARAAAAAAVALAPDSADAHRALGLVRMGLDWDFAAAAASARRALSLEPDHAGAHALLAQVHFVAGRRDATLAAIARARRAAPRSPAYHALSGNFAHAFDRLEEAERHYRRALELDPGDVQVAQALAKVEEELAGECEPGEPAAREVLDRLAASAARGQVRPWHVATLYAEVGDDGSALEWLDRAWAWHDTGLFFLRYDSRWDRYRDHPRVRAILSRLSPS